MSSSFLFLVWLKSMDSYHYHSHPQRDIHSTVCSTLHLLVLAVAVTCKIDLSVCRLNHLLSLFSIFLFLWFVFLFSMQIFRPFQQSSEYLSIYIAFHTVHNPSPVPQYIRCNTFFSLNLRGEAWGCSGKAERRVDAVTRRRLRLSLQSHCTKMPGSCQLVQEGTHM
ncbi:hypothetical protein C8Q75DRAFT_170797 [Abortiporus biennis]|nr:hypothetical protein C8Q75DRAFT_170797 [Abortiporus biennis]